MVTTQLTVLVLAHEPHVASEIALAARSVGYIVHAGRADEPGVDALERTKPDVALVHLGHPAVDSLAFRERASSMQTRILLFGFEDVVLHGSDPGEDAHAALPVVQLDSEHGAMVRTLEQALKDA